MFIRSGALTIDASEINADNYGSVAGGKLLLRADNQLALSNGAYVHSFAQANGTRATIILRSAVGGTLSADNSTVAVGGNGAGAITVMAQNMTIQNGGNVLAQSAGDGAGSGVAVSVGDSLNVVSGASLGTVAMADGNSGDVSVTVVGPITIDMAVGAATSKLAGIGLRDPGRRQCG